MAPVYSFENTVVEEDHSRASRFRTFYTGQLHSACYRLAACPTSGACSREAALHGCATTTPLVALCCLAWILLPCAS